MITVTRLAVVAFTLCAGAAVAEPPTATREQLNAVLWLQAATEYRAAALQTYRTAAQELVVLRSTTGTASVEQAAAGEFAQKPPAVVLDIDETVLDNSPYNAGLVQRGQAFDPTSWQAWVMARQARPIPGARDFILIALYFGYRVIYITNRSCNRQGQYDELGRSRDCPQKAATLDNLERALGYRPTDSDLFMRFESQRRDDSDKTARRREVAGTNRIVLQVGDDLSDFVRRSEYSEPTHAVHWGKRWFLIPNPLYGSWERAYPGLAAKYAGLNAWVADEAPDRGAPVR